MQIITNFSWVGIAVCIALGAAYAIVLYALGKRHQMSAKTRLLLAVLRFLAVFLISFLLLSPMLKTSVTETEKPVVVLLQDNSQSIVLNKDSAYYRNEYLLNFNDLHNSLSDKYAVEVFSFGGSLQNGFDGTYNQPTSDISLALNEIQDMYKGRNVGAVVLATDGIYNSGSQPSVGSSISINTPVSAGRTRHFISNRSRFQPTMAFFLFTTRLVHMIFSYFFLTGWRMTVFSFSGANFLASLR